MGEPPEDRPPRHPDRRIRIHRFVRPESETFPEKRDNHRFLPRRYEADVLFDVRTCTCRPGCLGQHLALYEEMGMAARKRHLGEPFLPPRAFAAAPRAARLEPTRAGPAVQARGRSDHPLDCRPPGPTATPGARP